mmetsp:Transcript_32366/g.78671  ORF Transcript_32366/g.78671 Transcript_32366/m.78671 type:complete len:224 (-) Transcript_32366:51-722(-)|eukprot:CAMPEP_0113631240 /NCGR_PEP_ID=MMETSP0017_2-20120614/16234_1 /TAXON_ID=2856 /ORGANISM="Cylindrotheca closterium" /LENGTH=223 /DNA_ID=CAMNT_0000541741 /DNA_START=64 /DNA_END=735 /DNA_ORIENTATION=- /assembly_acc=CAM_ASM_000147
MKLSKSLAFASILLSPAYSFAPASRPRASRFVSNSRNFVASAEQEAAVAETDSASKEELIETDVPEEEIIARIGITQEDLAIGVNAADFLKYAGTKDELIERFKEDNPSFDDDRATTEVTRFMMDAEMVNAFIRFQKDPQDLADEEEENILQTFGTYGAFLIGGGSIGYFRKNIYAPRVESGEWPELHFPWQNVGEAVTNAADSASDLTANIAHLPSDQIASM